MEGRHAQAHLPAALPGACEDATATWAVLWLLQTPAKLDVNVTMLGWVSTRLHGVLDLARCYFCPAQGVRCIHPYPKPRLVLRVGERGITPGRQSRLTSGVKIVQLSAPRKWP